MDYAHDAGLYGYCVYKHAETLPNITSVQQHCSQADKWSEECTQVWALSNINHYPLDDLLNVCIHHFDCAMQLLDAKPHNDVIIQMERCMRYTGHYKNDCVMHAAQAWYFDWPPPEEIHRVAKERAPFPEQIGMYIGARVACDGVGSCEGDVENQRMCEKYVRIFQDKGQCPNQHRMRRKKTRTNWQ